MKLVKEQVHNEPWRLVYLKVMYFKSRVVINAWTPVWDQVWDQVENMVKNELHNHRNFIL
jgi:hypothetical protein